MNNAVKIWGLMEKEDKKKSLTLFGITLLASIAEVVNISLIIPFVTILSSGIEESRWVKFINSIFQFDTNNKLINLITALMISLIVLSASIRYIQMKMQVKMSTEIAAKLSNKLFNKILKKELNWHNSRSSSQHLAGAEKARMLVSYVLYPTFFIITNSILGASIILAMLSNGRYFIFIPILFIGIIYIWISAKLKTDARIESKIFADSQANLTECMQEALGSIRDLKIYNLEEFYSGKHQQIITKMQKSLSKILQFAAGPRFLIEAIGAVTLLLIVVVINNLIENRQVTISKEELYGVILVIAFGFQRLLPILQGIYSSYTNIQGSRQSVNDVIEILQDKNDGKKDHLSEKIRGDITLINVSFGYDSHQILKNVNVTIPRGSIVGIIGTSGSGKTTFADILMGLLRPNDGAVKVGSILLRDDNVTSWVKNVSILSQQVFVVDGTVEDNIALGDKDKFDGAAYRNSLKRADLTMFETERGKMTIGERGSRISGGQKQRIGMARAYYKGAEYIFFDEPTSALDNNSEQIILDLLSHKNTNETIIIITHSKIVLNHVNLILEVRDGGVYEIKKGNI